MKIFTKTFKSGWQIMNIIQVKSRFTAQKKLNICSKKNDHTSDVKGKSEFWFSKSRSTDFALEHDIKNWLDFMSRISVVVVSNCVLLGMGMKSGIRFKNAGCKLLRSSRRRKTNYTLLSTNKYFLYWNIYLHTSFPIIRLLFF